MSVFIDPDAVKAVLESEQGKALTLPASQEIGGMLGDLVGFVRFSMNKNLDKISTGWLESRNQKPFEPEEVNRVLPLLLMASTVSDDELQSRWITLLETAARGDEDYRPSFGQTLNQITAEEARFLRNIWGSLSGPSGSGHPNKLTARNLLSIHHPDIHPNLVWTAPQARNTILEPRLLRLVDRQIEMKLMLDELVRLDILAAHSVDADHRGSGVYYRFTHYGAMFFRAVDSTA